MRPSSSGFTLLEVLLVLVILAVVAAMAIPALDRPFANQRLVKAADQVRSQLAKARMKAIESGSIRTFSCQLNSNKWHTESINLDGSTITADANDGSQVIIVPPVDDTLPDGVSFTNIVINDNTTTDPNATSDASNANSASDANSTSSLTSNIQPNNSQTDSALILFYPDGTSSSATVTVANNLGRSIDITLRGLTGSAMVGTIQATGGGP